MGILSSWKQRRAENRAAKTRSDEIDLNIEQESESFKQVCNVLLISIPKYETAASAFVERMKSLHDDGDKEISPVSLGHPSHLSVDDITAYFSVEAQRTQIVAEGYDNLYGADAAERGTVETFFKMGQLSIRVLQVYGQGYERRKWINLFGSITGIIFYASLCDYDERVDGQSKQTQLAESLSLFEEVINSYGFLRTPVILLFTDMAEFGTKIHDVPLTQYYPEYTGGADSNKAAKFILWRFMQFGRLRLNIYPHITEASDPSSLLLIFRAVKETIFQNALNESDFV